MKFLKYFENVKGEEDDSKIEISVWTYFNKYKNLTGEYLTTLLHNKRVEFYYHTLGAGSRLKSGILDSISREDMVFYIKMKNDDNQYFITSKISVYGPLDYNAADLAILAKKYNL